MTIYHSSTLKMSIHITALLSLKYLIQYMRDVRSNGFGYDKLLLNVVSLLPDLIYLLSEYQSCEEYWLKRKFWQAYKMAYLQIHCAHLNTLQEIYDQFFKNVSFNTIHINYFQKNCRSYNRIQFLFQLSFIFYQDFLSEFKKINLLKIK